MLAEIYSVFDPPPVTEARAAGPPTQA
jgi:hypothetical protein